MLNKLRLIFLLNLFCVSLLNAAPSLVPAPPNIGANAYLLLDHNSGYVIAEHNADQRIEPASLTKLMTAYVVLYEIQRGSISLDDEVKVSEKAWRMGGSRMFIEVNTKVSVNDLLKGLIVQSGNDAAVALAEHVADSEANFVALMNKHAQRLGLTSTQFANATGWPDPNHYSTARDLAKLSQAMINDFPEHYSWYKIKEYTYNNIRQSNRNRLLWLDESVDGIKTGHTESAGYCLISSALRSDMRLIAVVTGTNSETARINSSRKLLNYGFRFYETFLLHDANQALTDMRVWKGAEETVPLGISKPLYVTAPRGIRNRIKAKLQIDAMIEAPVTKGHEYGKINVMIDNEQLVSRPLIALASVDEGGLWTRLVDNIQLMFK